MSDKTGIEWTATRHADGTVTPGATWNPVRGCSKVSEGCRFCYAQAVAHRFSAPGQPYGGLAHVVNGKPEWTGKVMLVESVLRQPLRWTKPRRIFVDSMSDLFHPDVPKEYIWRVFAIMAAAPQHTFQVLTKRPERMRAILGRPGAVHEMGEACDALAAEEGWCHNNNWDWPLKNVWLGVSVENQAAEERILLLLRTPAAVRFLSCEPLLGAVRLAPYLGIAPDYSNTTDEWYEEHGWRYNADSGGFVGPDETDSLYDPQPGIHWVIVGGESGTYARPMHPKWAADLRDQCQESGVPYFFKQWGEYIPKTEVADFGGDLGFARWIVRHDWTTVVVGKPWGCLDIDGHYQPETTTWNGRQLSAYDAYEVTVYRVGKKAAGRLLDGREWNEYPATKERGAP